MTLFALWHLLCLGVVFFAFTHYRHGDWQWLAWPAILALFVWCGRFVDIWRENACPEDY